MEVICGPITILMWDVPSGSRSLWPDLGTRMNTSTAYIIDDDPAVLRSLSLLVEEVGLRAQGFNTAQAFLDAYDCTRPGCLVLDVRLPGMSGMDLQAALNSRHIQIPIIMISGHGDIPMAVKAVRAGALDFIEKPFRDQVVLDAIHKAIALDAHRPKVAPGPDDLAQRRQRLSERQRRIMDLFLVGKPCKVIAHELGLSPKTIDYHKGRILETMGCDSIVELAHHLHTQAPT